MYTDIIFSSISENSSQWELSVTYNNDVYKTDIMHIDNFNTVLFNIRDLNDYLSHGLYPEIYGRVYKNELIVYTSVVFDSHDKMYLTVLVTDIDKSANDWYTFELTNRSSREIEDGINNSNVIRIYINDNIFFYFEECNQLFGTEHDTESIEFAVFFRREIYRYFKENQEWWSQFRLECINNPENSFSHGHILEKIETSSSYQAFVSNFTGERADEEKSAFILNDLFFILNYVASKMRIVRVNVKYNESLSAVESILIQKKPLVSVSSAQKIVTDFSFSNILNMPSRAFRELSASDCLVYEILE